MRLHSALPAGTFPLARFARLGLMGAVAAAALVACEPARKAEETPAAGPDAKATAGKIGGKTITVGEVDEWIKDQLYAQATRGKNAMKVYEVRNRALEQMANEQAMDDAAAKAGKDPEALLKEEVEKRASVSDQDVQAYYDQNKERFRNMPFEKVAPAVKRQLLAQKQVAAMQEYTKSLREQVGYENELEPPRFEIDVTGPAQGPGDAPIVLVEFSDYECPFCKAAEPVVKQVLQRYPTQVKFVHKHYPLEMHPKARPAAEAAACAEEQGKFWELHAKLFEKAPQIAPEQLSAIATEAGLDPAKLQECITAKKGAARVDSDLDAGKKAGVAGTPSFFVNGVPVAGGRSVDDFAKAINAELTRLGKPVPAAPAPVAQPQIQPPHPPMPAAPNAAAPAPAPGPAPAAVPAPAPPAPSAAAQPAAPTPAPAPAPTAAPPAPAPGPKP